MEILILVALMIGLVPAFIAQSKGKNFLLWWLYGAAIFIAALPHSLLIKADSKTLEADALADGGRKCPFCAEVVKAEAKVCRFCQRDLPAIEKEPVERESDGTFKPQGECPNCKKRISTDSAQCKHCGALFDGPGWTVKPLS